MSADYVEEAEAAADMMLCCASCGVAEVDDIKLKKCADCDLVKYCSDKCQQEHRPTHEEMCRERMVELRDEILFRQPEGTHLGDCPICFLPLSLDLFKYVLSSCCSKIICNGCSYTNALREMDERLQHRCPFCRYPALTTEEEFDRHKMKRVAANDPVAIRELGANRYEEGDYGSAIEYLKKASELGDAKAHFNLSVMYRKGEGVEKDEKMGLYHLEEASIAGYPKARYYLAINEWRMEIFDRAVKHWIIAANLGHDESMKALKECYAHGKVSKEDFAAALRAHHAAVDATKSPQRDVAEKALAKARVE